MNREGAAYTGLGSLGVMGRSSAHAVPATVLVMSLGGIGLAADCSVTSVGLTPATELLTTYRPW